VFFSIKFDLRRLDDSVTRLQLQLPQALAVPTLKSFVDLRASDAA